MVLLDIGIWYFEFLFVIWCLFFEICGLSALGFTFNCQKTTAGV